MRSRAHIKAHPIHPALVPFPFAFLAGALPFDLLGMFLEKPGLSVTAAYLTIAGLSSGLLAAIPGAVDYLYSVPPHSSGKQRATKHAVGNVAALALFGGGLLLRGPQWYPSSATIGLELLGVCALLYAGWLGGTLVTRNL